MFEEPIEELAEQARALGMRIDASDAYCENSGALYFGNELVCYVYYSEYEDGWADTDQPVGFCPGDQVLEGRLDSHLRRKQVAARELRFQVTVEYPDDAPPLPPESAEAFARLVSTEFVKLLPGKPSAVVVNGHRHELRRKAARRT